MPISELIQEMMFVNSRVIFRDNRLKIMCVKFRDNQLKNEVCRAVTKFQGARPLLVVGGGGGVVYM